MTKYYLKLNINYIHINKLIKKNSNNYIYNKKIIFTKEGFIKKEKMEYVKYILDEEKKSEKIVLDDLECLVDYSYEKKIGNVYQIPLEHILINLKKYIFKPYDGSQIQFVIETSNHNIVDYYFEKKEEDLKFFEIKNEIISFLNDLRNILYI